MENNRPTTRNHPIALHELTESDQRILQAVREVQYGSVEITIHHRRVVQVERREKIRLSEPPPGEAR